MTPARSGSQDESLDEILRLLGVLSERYRARRRRVMAGCNLTPAMALLLRRLATADGQCMSVSEIAQEACVANSTVSATLKRLERRGLVVRQRDTSDERRVLVALTTEGRRTVDQSPDPDEAAPLLDVLRKLSPEERERLLEWLQVLCAAYEERAAAT